MNTYIEFRTQTEACSKYTKSEGNFFNFSLGSPGRNRRLKATINPPPSEETSHAKYLTACSLALEPSIESLIIAALDAGWKREFVLLAVMMIIMDYEKGTLSFSRFLHS